MLLLYAIFLGLFCCPTSIKATLTISENAKPGEVIFNHTKEGGECKIMEPSMKKIYFVFNDTRLLINETPDLEEDEALCNGKTIVLKYNCSDKQTGKVPTYSLPLTIEPIDEFPPKFDLPKFYSFLKEEEPIGTKVKYANGTDIDFKNHVHDEDCDDDRLNLELHGSQMGIFRLSGSSIVTNRVIDYETDDNMYNLTLNAENDPDDPTQANSSYVNVELTVIPHELAHDQDLGINQTLNYTLLDKKEFISINDVTGAISLSKQLDREHEASYSFQIKAFQTNSEQRFALTKMDLIVDDINDNHAVFNRTFIQVAIQENLATGSFIKVVQAVDADVGINSKFRYVISEGALTVDPATGIVSVVNSSALDRETDDRLTFQISTIPENEVVSDGPCPNCNVTLNVTLIDVNDNNPIFNDSPYLFTVEDNVPGEHVGKVSAEDADKDENALVRYSIESQTSDFSINSITGEITLQRQTTLPTSILVEACDNPIIISLRRCSIVQVNIQSKDNSSVTGHDIVIDVFENLPVNSSVAEVSFYSNRFKYDLQTNDDFMLIKNIIKTKVKLDRENIQCYSLQLNVLNGSQTQNSYFVNITVKDVNDNAPEFVQSNYLFSLTDDMKSGSFIGKVEATDKDEGVNANVTYYLEGQNSKYFSIGTTDGGISLSTMPDIGLTQQFLSLIVRAADSGQPSLQNLTVVQIHVGLGNGTIRIPVGTEKNTIVDDKGKYEKALTDILGVDTEITSASSSGAGGSVIYISASNGTDEIPLNDLSRRVYSKWDAIQELFKREQQSVPPTADNGMSSEAIALIAVACVLFVGSILLTAVTYYKFKRYQRLQRLVHNLSRKNSIYETQETSIAIEEEEVSDYYSTSTQNLIKDDKTSANVPNGQVSGFVNPGYVADEHLSTERQNSSQNTELELDNDLDQPTASSETPDNILEHKVEKDYNEPHVDDANNGDTENPLNEDLLNNDESINDPVNDDIVKHEEITNVTNEDRSLVDTDKSEGFFVPAPPPLPDILPSLSKSSSSSELMNTTHKPPADALKTPNYENVLFELSAAVKKRSAGEEDVEDEPEIDPEFKGVPNVHNENLPTSLEVIDLDEAGPEDLNTSSNLSDLDEPEPDYAKRVRFNEDGVKDETTPPKIEKSEDSDDDQPHLGHDLRNSEEIKSPEDSVNGESGTFVFGQVEITEL
ncbi:hypothetical protein LOTGIDRAFT_232259 [Lottia gigantea]|uniref:Cadherin domain-containing protein n=1 Tax=Lottia gigantea TaxID=225164 RepID=V4AHY3_LOTGI|nr:hypothetical protein LOTGIDRAFT_232259 [Lottia gigantea]ESO94810.1 hypothetical protein LOTGIDRAFT_232259 [Lottia gigantea]